MTTVIYFFTIRELESTQSAIESQIRRIAQNIATMQLLEQQDWTVYQDYISQLMAFNEDIVYIAIYDDRNTLRAHTLNQDLIEFERSISTRRMQADLIRNLDSGTISAEDEDDLRVERVNIQVGNRVLGSVNVGFSLIDINNELNNKIRLNIALSMVFLILFIGASIIIGGRLTRPLEKLTTAMTAVNEGSLDQKVEPETRDEIAELTNTFNQMLDVLREKEIIEGLGHDLSGTFQIENLAPLVRERLRDAIGAASARLYVRNNADNLFHEITVSESKNNKYPPLSIDEKLKSYILERKSGFMIHSVQDNIMNALRHKRQDEAGLVVPMLVKGTLFGLLFFALPPGEDNFSTKQIHFASILANQAALALDNALLYEELREQDRIKRELEIAREVQQKLLPSKMPELPGYQFEGVCKSAQEVGGDYFDFFHLDNDLLGIVIADVSGKGTSASFYMAELKGMMIQLTSKYQSPKSLLVELNRKLFGNVDRRVFVTMIYGVLDLNSNEFVFSRAGHNSLLKIGTNGKHDFLTPPGIGLGLEGGEIFNKKLEEATVQMQKDEMLILYTDGITEARNENNIEYGEERLLHSVTLTKKRNVSEKKEAMLNSLNHFMNGNSPHDDITLLLIHHCG
jgi:serine phosphatase RsbU (regulator of sigma subunit)/HAMP domain-containing protein